MPKKTQSNIKIALVGAAGRMGREIDKLAAEVGLTVTARIDKSADWRQVKPKEVDIIVDFSTPEGLAEALAWACDKKKPLVSGSTGLSAKQHRDLQAAAKKLPILYSGNMSLGIAVFTSMLKSLKAIADWDFQIEEVHHKHKKDRPSGTALLLQKALVDVVGDKVPAAQSLRGGGVPGIHTLWAMGPEETLTVQHSAFNRQVFARGALRAALWLFDKKQAGLYDLADLYTT